MIIPKDRRVLVYSVLENIIINAEQKELYANSVISQIIKKRNECVLAMSDDNNLMSFVYVYKNGDIETETNVSKPKFEFHSEYNND